MEKSGMNKDDCWAIIHKFDEWDICETSLSVRCGGHRKPEDEVYDARRKLIISAYERLADLIKENK